MYTETKDQRAQRVSLLNTFVRWNSIFPEFERGSTAIRLFNKSCINRIIKTNNKTVDAGKNDYGEKANKCIDDIGLIKEAIFTDNENLYNNDINHGMSEKKNSQSKNDCQKVNKYLSNFNADFEKIMSFDHNICLNDPFNTYKTNDNTADRHGHDRYLLHNGAVSLGDKENSLSSSNVSVCSLNSGSKDLTAINLKGVKKGIATAIVAPQPSQSQSESHKGESNCSIYDNITQINERNFQVVSEGERNIGDNERVDTHKDVMTNKLTLESKFLIGFNNNLDKTPKNFPYKDVITNNSEDNSAREMTPINNDLNPGQELYTEENRVLISTHTLTGCDDRYGLYDNKMARPEFMKNNLNLISSVDENKFLGEKNLLNINFEAEINEKLANDNHENDQINDNTINIIKTLQNERINLNYHPNNISDVHFNIAGKMEINESSLDKNEGNDVFSNLFNKNTEDKKNVRNFDIDNIMAGEIKSKDKDDIIKSDFNFMITESGNNSVCGIFGNNFNQESPSEENRFNFQF
ncbi:GATA zinc finger domain-containing protein 14-like [Gordionus sp. m RMFG-2023]|uniref:GATA zinc finger domain-containing protein 14-like n=1 Tax=Gordionus sp. m RMFG-2023 TaxID=3053472 RepID=UPI0031FD1B1A